MIICLSTFCAFSQKPEFLTYHKFSISMNFAGENKTELQQVIDHYSRSQRDSLKLKAAYFLIANMTGHFSYRGYLQQGIDSLIRYGTRTKKISGYDFWQQENDAQINQLWNAVMANAATSHAGEDYLFDNKVISAKLLIENIDYAFKAWEMPWSRHLCFDEFCSYVLPYRFYDEALESWRPRYMQKFSWLAEAMGNSSDPVLACKLINESLRREFPFNREFGRYGKALGPNSLLDGGLGKCLDQAGIANFAMRAMGIPVTLEVVQQWANRSFGHDFSSVLNKDGKFVSFLGAEVPPNQYQLPYVAPKIYTLGYAIQDDSLLADEMGRGAWSEYRDRFRTDATQQFIPVNNLIVELRPGAVNAGETVKLCVFDNHYWIPVSTSISADGMTVLFKDMGLGVLYLPMVLRDKLIPVSPPLILQKDQSVRAVQIDKLTTDTISISRKYPLSQEKLDWIKLMLDGRFEGANTADFSGSKTLYNIQNPFYMMLNRRPISRQSFRYVRYCFPKSSGGSLAEICFYGDSSLTEALKGMPIHSSKVSDRDTQLAFDGYLSKYINTPGLADYDHEWVGLDFGSPKNIAGIGFSPRNDENGIDQRMNYELYYWDDHWVSLGHGVYDNVSKLKFKNVPIGALLWLRNHTSGNEERIFLYENNSQEWW